MLDQSIRDVLKGVRMKDLRLVLAMLSLLALESLAISLTTCGGTGGPVHIAVTPADQSIPVEDLGQIWGQAIVIKY